MCRLEGQIILAVDLREIPEAAAGIRGRLSRGRRAAEVIARIGRVRGTGTLSRVLAVHEEGAVSDYFHSSSLVSVFVLVVAGLDGAVDSDQATLGEILADEFRLLSPGDDVDEIGLTLPVPARKSTVTSYRKGADRYPIGSLLQFRVRGEAADQNSLVIHSDTALLSNNHGTQYADVDFFIIPSSFR